MQKISNFLLIITLISGCSQNPDIDSVNPTNKIINEKQTKKINVAKDYIAENKINATDNANVSIINHGSSIHIDNSMNLQLGFNYETNKTWIKESKIKNNLPDIDDAINVASELETDNNGGYYPTKKNQTSMGGKPEEKDNLESNTPMFF